MTQFVLNQGKTSEYGQNAVAVVLVTAKTLFVVVAVVVVRSHLSSYTFAPCARIGAMQPETDDERQARKRLNAIRAVKKSTDYVALLVQESCCSGRGQRPTTPDRDDRTLSKRSWEKAIQQWRRDLKFCVAQLPLEEKRRLIE